MKKSTTFLTNAPNKLGLLSFHQLPHQPLLGSPSQWQQETDNLPENIAQWLRWEHSLTAALCQHCSQFDVVVLAEDFLPQQKGKNPTLEFFPKFCESSLWRRCVVLQGDGEPWIYAETFTPSAKLARTLQQLGDTPLGLWLFAQKPRRESWGWREFSTENHKISPNIPALPITFARFTRWQIDNEPLLIVEYFLTPFAFPIELSKVQKSQHG